MVRLPLPVPLEWAKATRRGQKGPKAEVNSEQTPTYFQRPLQVLRWPRRGAVVRLFPHSQNPIYRANGKAKNRSDTVHPSRQAAGRDLRKPDILLTPIATLGKLRRKAGPPAQMGSGRSYGNLLPSQGFYSLTQSQVKYASSHYRINITSPGI